MKCPFCQIEMESGVIQSVLDICWLSEATAPLRKPIHGKDAERLESDGNWLQFPYLNALRCRKCKIILILK